MGCVRRSLFRLLMSESINSFEPTNRPVGFGISNYGDV